MPIGFQCIFRAENDQVLTPDPATRRALAALFIERGHQGAMFGFGIGDTHAHTIHDCAAAVATKFARYTRTSMAQLLSVPMKPVKITPINDMFHAEELLRYVHRQDTHHGANLDPLREGTSLPDLMGLRPAGLWLAGRVRETCPRVERDDLLAQWGISEFSEVLDLPLLAVSGAAAIGTADLLGNLPAQHLARCACVHAAAGTPAYLIAQSLGITERGVRRLMKSAPDAAMVRAVRLQMGLRQMITVDPESYFLRPGGLRPRVEAPPGP